MQPSNDRTLTDDKRISNALEVVQAINKIDRRQDQGLAVALAWTLAHPDAYTIGRSFIHPSHYNVGRLEAIDGENAQLNFGSGGIHSVPKNEIIASRMAINAAEALQYADNMSSALRQLEGREQPPFEEGFTLFGR